MLTCIAKFKLITAVSLILWRTELIELSENYEHLTFLAIVLKYDPLDHYA